MTVFVDPLMNWGWKKGASCHMYTDGNIAELHAIADRIGLQRSWFQALEKNGLPRLVPHYDLVASKRILALKAGAVDVDLRHLGQFIAIQRKERRTKNG